MSRVLGSRTAISLEELSAASGAAGTTGRSVIENLRRVAPDGVRSVTTEDYLESVIVREQIEECTRTLGAVFGSPAKPFRERAKVMPPLYKLVESRGGVRRNQCLYLCRFEDGHVAFAALWPWAQMDKLTLRVGVYDDVP